MSFVDVGLRVLAEEGIFRVPGDAHDLGPGLAGAEEVEALAQRVALRPELLGHRLVDDGDLRAARLVVLRDRAALHDGDPHGLEVSGSDRVHLNERAVVLVASSLQEH